MKKDTPADAQARRDLIDRWRRVQMHVRCGLSMRLPGSVRLYVGIGMALARSNVLPPLTTYLQLLHTLLQTAQDEALPLQWRSVCLEYVDRPLAATTSMLAYYDPIASNEIHTAVRLVRERLPLSAPMTDKSP